MNELIWQEEALDIAQTCKLNILRTEQRQNYRNEIFLMNLILYFYIRVNGRNQQMTLYGYV